MPPALRRIFKILLFQLMTSFTWCSSRGKQFKFSVSDQSGRSWVRLDNSKGSGGGVMVERAVNVELGTMDRAMTDHIVSQSRIANHAPACA